MVRFLGFIWYHMIYCREFLFRLWPFWCLCCMQFRLCCAYNRFFPRPRYIPCTAGIFSHFPMNLSFDEQKYCHSSTRHHSSMRLRQHEMGRSFPSLGACECPASRNTRKSPPRRGSKAAGNDGECPSTSLSSSPIHKTNGMGTDVSNLFGGYVFTVISVILGLLWSLEEKLVWYFVFRPIRELAVV